MRAQPRIRRTWPFYTSFSGLPGLPSYYSKVYTDYCMPGRLFGFFSGKAGLQTNTAREREVSAEERVSETKVQQDNWEELLKKPFGVPLFWRGFCFWQSEKKRFLYCTLLCYILPRGMTHIILKLHNAVYSSADAPVGTVLYYD